MGIAKLGERQGEQTLDRNVLAAGLTLQTPYGALEATPETYQPPVVRPFEPPSDFGRELADHGIHEFMNIKTVYVA